MLEFRCTACTAPIVVRDDQRGQPVTCRNCNTRNIVPAGALVHVLPPGSLPASPVQPVNPVPPTPREPISPRYLLVDATVIILWLLGIFMCANGLISGMRERELFISTSGVLIAAAGTLLHLLRHMAKDLWSIRQALATREPLPPRE